MMIKEFQENWDAAMAGDEMATSRLKFVPGGAGGYVPTKKPDDMRFQEFNDWLLKVTCSVFEVMPTEIGFMPKGGLGGKGFTEEASQVENRKAIMPLARFFEEIFTRIIHEDFGFIDLAFSFNGLEEKDAKLDAEVNEILIRSGQRTVNELRTDEGLNADPSPEADKLFIIGSGVTFLKSQDEIDQAQATAEAIQTSTAQPQEVAPTEPTQPEVAKSDRPDHITLVTEMRKFRTMALNRIKKGKSYRSFSSDVLPEEVIAELNQKLEDCTDPELAKGIFNEFMADYQINFLADVVELQKGLEKVLS